MILSWSFLARASPKPWNFSQEKREPHRRRTDLAPRPFPTSGYRPQTTTTEQRGTTSQAARRIDEDVTGFFFARGDIYEDAAHHKRRICGAGRGRNTALRPQQGNGGKLPADMKGSDKAFNFCYRGEGDRLFVLKPPLTCSLSSACSKRRGRSKATCHWAAWEKKPCCVSSLTVRTSRLFTSALPATKPETTLAAALRSLLPEGYTVHRLVPLYKDWNEVLQRRAEITDGSISGSGLRFERAAAGRKPSRLSHERGGHTDR